MDGGGVLTPEKLFEHLRRIGVQIIIAGDGSMSLRVPPDVLLGPDDKAILAEHRESLRVLEIRRMRREGIANWDVPIRQAWGERANELEDQGLGWDEAEEQAFKEVQARVGRGEKFRAPVGSGIGNENVADLEPGTKRWSCGNPTCQHGDRWWVNHWGVINCINCVPPAIPELVVKTGTREDAPIVKIGQSHQAVGVTYASAR